MPLIRSISGLRAVAGDGLLPCMIADYAAAFSAKQPHGEIVVGRDGRPSGNWIKNILTGALTASGRKVRNLGIVPTPTVQLEVETTAAAGGIVITASHNPGEWNGLKFLDETGVFLDKQQNDVLWDILDNKRFSFIEDIKLPETETDDYAIDKHIQTIFKIPLFKDNYKFIEKIRDRKLKVVVDAVNAAGSLAIPNLLDKFGCEVVYLYCDESGVFPHTPEPLPINLQELAENVKLHKADLGIAVDPDADRLVLIDEKGEPIGEEKTIVMAAWAVFENIEQFDSYDKSAVINFSSSKLLEDLASEYGVKVERSAVGEINVVKKMKEVNAVIGGEGSGGVILPACHYGRDSLVGTALVLALLTQKNASLSELSSQLPDYSMIKLKKEFSGDLEKLFSKIEDKFTEAKPVKLDGIKYIFNDSWIQIRASNTEPIVRVIAEARSKKEAEKLAYDVLKII